MCKGHNRDIRENPLPIKHMFIILPVFTLNMLVIITIPHLYKKEPRDT